MKCQYCGSELQEDVVFCTNCGKSVAEEGVVQETAQPTEQIKDVAEKVKNVAKKGSKGDIIQLIIGTIIIIIGFSRLGQSSVSISSTSFGADFYTYAYRGIVACANMLGKINATISWLIIVLGVMIDLKAVKGFKK
ncbi:MAG: zinc ribbon domain-containing protein [Tyzzerella sp.]|nr:zinc ribbon domain-containing protein [Tyzzerella sp.]